MCGERDTIGTQTGQNKLVTRECRALVPSCNYRYFLLKYQYFCVFCICKNWEFYFWESYLLFMLYYNFCNLWKPLLSANEKGNI